MEQARNYVCTECASAVPSGHKFCGACGAPVPAEAQTLDTQYFGAMQMPGKARLIVVRGDEAMGEGLSYLLQATEHVAGRENFFSLEPSYTDDGGHLNEVGRLIVAREMVRFLARVSNSNSN